MREFVVAMACSAICNFFTPAGRALKPGLLLACWVSAALAQRPPYRSERFEENWSFLRDPAQRTDVWDRWKYLPLGSRGVFFTFAGEMRERYEILDQPGFGRGPEDKNGYLLQRYLFASDLHVGPHFRFFAEFQSGIETGRNGGPRSTDVNRLDASQGFIDYIDGNTTTGEFRVRVGRHEVNFGSGRLLSPAEGLNVRRAFDGIRLRYERGPWILNLMALRPATAQSGIFDDRPDHTQTLWGGGVLGPHPFWPGATMSTSYFGLDKKVAVFASGTGRQTRHTLGARNFRTAGPWDFNYEWIVQWGSFAGRSIRAWALASDTGFTFRSVPFRPRFGWRTDVTSGDGGKAGRLGTFDPLFPSASAYSGNAGLLGPSNLLDLTPSVQIHPRRDLTVTVDAPFYWRTSLADGIYSGLGSVVRTSAGNSARFVGTSPAITNVWQLDRHASVTAMYSRFQTGSFFRAALPDRRVDYMALTWMYKF
jgi:hypothetical protein